ncbi:MAG TPA: ABC transporter ATP-binding protein [Bacteroidales bacterium]|jgi:NitT/TauT family transport system ATP-binding protein|nr:ABC transporter ATP-binding protein [Bacteroidales bacterium]HPY67693.1 ABC transporter ATP-binding protein [Bacteroidales bacterium]
MSLEIKALYKKYDTISLFSDFNISFQEGTITCILGPSGCGKTTLLNIIGDIIKPDSGQLTGFREKTASYIFQDPRLLPWKTVEENIGFVLSKDMPAEERKKITRQLIRLMELENFASYYPSKLSGGMRQRVSIARAFAYPSDIILMDEPLKGLDIKLKLNLIRIFSQMWLTDKRTVIFVTHDVDEALLLGNDIIVLSRPPVKIITKKQLDLPFEERRLDSDSFRELKRNLISALGNQ